MGNWLPLVRFSPACIGAVLLDGYRSLFFLLLQVPSSEQCLRRLLCRRRQKKKERKRNPPIAVLTSEPLHSSFFPQQGHFHTSSWQNIKHNKKVPLLLRGRGKQITHLLHWEASSNPFSGLSLEHSLCSFPKFHRLW